MSKARAALLAYVLEGTRSAGGHALGAELAAWADTRGQFEAFLAANRDKVRKKLRSAGDDDALLDVRAELFVASLLCGDRRFAIEFEAYGRGKRGPDLTVLFRTNLPFNVEVTRLRPSDAAVVTRLQGVLLAKLRQLAAGLPNVLALVAGEGVAVTAEDVRSAAKHLQQLADRKEEAVFARRGYESAREFLGYFARLSGVVVVAGAPAEMRLWGNAQARHPLPREVVTALVGCTTPSET